MKRKLISLLLVLMLCAGMTVPAFATSKEATAAAEELYELGLFNGVGDNPDGTPNFALDRGLTRQEAVTLLVRLLGKEADALAGAWENQFTDVSEWAKPYVGYAFANRLTNGISATEFGSTTQVSATQYLTFVLRALGYESGKDFEWDSAWTLTDELGITVGEYNADTEFLRGDAAIVSNNTLYVEINGSDKTLLDVVHENLAPASDLIDADRYNDYVNEKIGITVVLPAGWMLLDADDITELFGGYGLDFDLAELFGDEDMQIDLSVCINIVTGDGIGIASLTIPEEEAEELTFDALLEELKYAEEILADSGLALVDPVEICGHTYIGFSMNDAVEGYALNLYISVFNGELVVISVLSYSLTVDTILGYFE